MSSLTSQMLRSDREILLAILSELQKQYSEGLRNPFIDVLTCTAGGTFQKMYSNAKFVKTAEIINLTTTAATIVTIKTSASTGITAGTAGYLINAGSAQHVVGANSLIVDNVDLSEFYWTATNTSDAICVYYEVSNFPNTGIGLG